MFINIADLEDPSDTLGRTYREINAAKSHQIPIGSLVEEKDTGVRLFVSGHTRDCDQTPLYSLSAYQDAHEQERYPVYHGYSENSLSCV